MKQKHWVWLGMVFIISAICVSYTAFFFANRVYAGVAVEGVTMTGLTSAEVEDILRLWQKKDSSGPSEPFNFYAGEQKFILDPRSVEYIVDPAATAASAIAWGREGTYWDRLKKISQATLNGCHIPLKIRYNETKLDDLVGLWRDQVDKPPKNAAFSLLQGKITSAEIGLHLDEKATKLVLLQTMQSSERTAVFLPVEPIYPSLTAEEVAATGIKAVLGQFKTRFDATDRNRSANIYLAVRQIDGKLLSPGQTFSFNETVGPRDKEHGFKEALEIAGNEYVPGIGGGVCQVSSTLYNAALLANLKIEERYNHSKSLGYVKLGRDATVAYGVLDFKFTNNTAEPILIVAEVENGEVCIGLLGRQKPHYQVDIVTASHKAILPGVIRKTDDNLLLGETEVERQGTPGYEVTTLRVVTEGNKEIKREILANDQYLPEDSVIHIGTRRPDF